MNILVDTNVVLDALLDREPHSEAAVTILDLIESKTVTGYLAGTTVTKIFCLVQKTSTDKNERKIIEDLLTLFKVAPIDEAILKASLKNEFKDYEDGVIYEAALKVNAELIVTRNIKDFKQSKLLVLSPVEFLSTLQL